MGLKPKEGVLSLNGGTLSQEAAKAKNKKGFRKAWTNSPGQVYQEPSWTTGHYSKAQYAGTAHEILLVEKK